MTTLEDIRIESLTRENEKLKADLKQAEARISQAEAGQRIASIAAASGVMPKAIPDVVTRALSAGTWKMDPNSRQFYRVGADGLPDIAAMGGTVTLESMVATLRQDAPHLWPEGEEPQAPAGGPAQARRPSSMAERMVPRSPNSGPVLDDPENPWSKSGWNVTRQAAIAGDDHAKALKLAMAAGKPIRANMKVGEPLK